MIRMNDNQHLSKYWLSVEKIVSIGDSYAGIVAIYSSLYFGLSVSMLLWLLIILLFKL